MLSSSFWITSSNNFLITNPTPKVKKLPLVFLYLAFVDLRLFVIVEQLRERTKLFLLPEQALGKSAFDSFYNRNFSIYAFMFDVQYKGSDRNLPDAPDFTSIG